MTLTRLALGNPVAAAVAVLLVLLFGSIALTFDVGISVERALIEVMNRRSIRGPRNRDSHHV